MLVKESGGTMDVSKLADESEQNVDSLLPLIEACKMLGLVTVEAGEIRLTPEGEKMDMKNFTDMIAKKLSGIEPFKSALGILSVRKGGLSTEELAHELQIKGIMLHGDFKMNSALLRSMLLKWAVRTRLVVYSDSSDLWELG